jgi:hypothetical protein
MTGPGFHVVLNQSALLAVAEMAEVRAEVQHLGEEIARDAREHAPRAEHHHGRTPGHGADTIHAEPGFDEGGWRSRVSWDQVHAYMWYPNRGTKYQPGQHFLEQALERHAHTI